MTLYLKYRPQSVSELDLASARETLTNILKSGKIPHAFLFAGPKGTGKTSSARILAKSVSCMHKKKHSFEPCNECEVCRAITSGAHPDVLEMDAASNRGIDEVRALKNEMVLAPIELPKKIYIIDEVHMLTPEASNAFLKTLEEPPAHVMFILATTDPLKLPPTVLSRLTLVQFKKATIKEIVEKLKKISELEKFQVEDGVLEKIAESADGSFRDAVKTLEALSLGENKITNQKFDENYFVGHEISKKIMTLLSAHEIDKAILLVSELGGKGVDGKALVNSLINEAHEELLKSVGVQYASKNTLSREDAISLLELFLEAKARVALGGPEVLPLEIAIAKFQAPPMKLPEKKVQALPKEGIPSEKSKNTLSGALVKVQDDEAKASSPQGSEPLLLAGEVSQEKWAMALQKVRQQNISMEALLRASKPKGISDGKLKVEVFYKFHKEKLETPSVSRFLDSVFEDVFGGNLKLFYELSDPPPKTFEKFDTPSLTTPKEPDIINAAKEIFGM